MKGIRPQRAERKRVVGQLMVGSGFLALLPAFPQNYFVSAAVVAYFVLVADSFSSPTGSGSPDCKLPYRMRNSPLPPIHSAARLPRRERGVPKDHGRAFSTG
jgi:hypothetical protein